MKHKGLLRLFAVGLLIFSILGLAACDFDLPGGPVTTGPNLEQLGSQPSGSSQSTTLSTAAQNGSTGESVIPSAPETSVPVTQPAETSEVVAPPTQSTGTTMPTEGTEPSIPTTNPEPTASVTQPGTQSTAPKPTQTQPKPTQTQPKPTQTEPKPTQTQPKPTEPYVPQGNTQMPGLQVLLSQANGLELAKAYDAIAAAVAQQQERLDLDNVPVSQLRMVYDCVRSDYIHYFWMPRGYSYYHRDDVATGMVLEYAWTGDALEAAKRQIEAIVQPMLAPLHDGMSDYEKALHLHDVLVDFCTYNNVGDCYTVYGVLTSGNAICQGYAETYQYLLYRVGITSYIVGNDNHAWNAVKMDGHWYYTDVTWDDPLGNDGTAEYHAYFGLTKAMMEDSRDFIPSYFPLPEGDSLAGNYYAHIGRLVETFDKDQVTEWLKTPGEVYFYVTGDVELYKAQLKEHMWDMQAAAGMELTGYLLYPHGRELRIVFV